MTYLSEVRNLSAAPLFKPFTIGRTKLRNRIVMAPMTRNYAPQGIPGEDVADYYARRARGGTGLILTEGTWIPHQGAHNEPRVPKFFGEPALAGWERVVAAVHAAGGCIMPQLWHVGLIHKRPPDYRGLNAILAEPRQLGPSGIVGGMGFDLERVRSPMTQIEIDAVIDAFARSAVHAHALGFDGVELHGAHGYIIDQFLWKRTNRRRDRYGGSIARRARFAAEVVAEIRRRTAPDFPILMRWSQWKMHDYQARLAESPAELEAMLTPLVDAGVDLFDCSQRRYFDPTFAGSSLNLAGWTKKLSGKPTMTVGSVGLERHFMKSLFGRNKETGIASIGPLLEQFERGEFDLVGVGRGLLADPDWANKVERAGIEGLTPYRPNVLQSLV